MPEKPSLDDARDQGAAARHQATQTVMEAYTSRFDPRELPQTYPPDSEWRDRAYNDLSRVVEEVAGNFQSGVDRNAVLDHVANEAVGLGPLEYYLDDDAITEIHVVGSDRILVQRDGRMTLAPYVFTSPEFVYLAAQRILSMQGYSPDNAPAVSGVRFNDGTLVQVVLPPVAVGSPVITLTKPRRDFPNLGELVGDGTLSNSMAEFIHQCIDARQNILVVGPAGSGRTTLVNALLGLVPDGARIVAVESTSMLQMPQNSAVALEAQPSSPRDDGQDMATLVSEAARLRPDRLVVDDIRGAEALSLLEAIAGGATGSMGVTTALSAADGLRQLGTLASLAARAGSGREMLQHIARTIDIVVATGRGADGTRRVVEIAETNGVGVGSVRLETVFAHDPDRTGPDGQSGKFSATGYVPRFYRELENGGVRLDTGIFRD